MADGPVIRIELAPGPWTEPEFADYRFCGRPVRGQVVVQTDDWLNCRGVVVSLGWHTEGRGVRDQQTVWEQRVHDGELTPGQHRFDFSGRLPSGPMSYSGHYINIIWQVKARIDLAWRRDPAAEKTIYAVVPEPAET